MIYTPVSLHPILLVSYLIVNILRDIQLITSHSKSLLDFKHYSLFSMFDYFLNHLWGLHCGNLHSFSFDFSKTCIFGTKKNSGPQMWDGGSSILLYVEIVCVLVFEDKWCVLAYVLSLCPYLYPSLYNFYMYFIFC